MGLLNVIRKRRLRYRLPIREIERRTGLSCNSNAACFDKYQCDYDGFTCKSNVTECIAAHDQLLQEHNTQVSDYNLLLMRYQKPATDFDEITAAVSALQSDYGHLESTLSNIKSCLICQQTTTTTTAQTCGGGAEIGLQTHSANGLTIGTAQILSDWIDGQTRTSGQLSVEMRF